jgi:uncharacterized membrane protein
MSMKNSLDAFGGHPKPKFNRVIPMLLVFLTPAAFVFFTWTAIQVDGAPWTAWSIMAPVAVLLLATAHGLSRGRAYGWFLWAAFLLTYFVGSVSWLITLGAFGYAAAALLVGSSIFFLGTKLGRWREMRRHGAVAFAMTNGVALVVVLFFQRMSVTTTYETPGAPTYVTGSVWDISATLPPLVFTGVWILLLIWTSSEKVLRSNNIE